MGKILKLNNLLKVQPAGEPVLTPSQEKKLALYLKMVEDFCTNMRARRCKDEAINKAKAHIREFHEHSGKYPWEWGRDDFEAFCAFLFKEKKNSVGTQRIKQHNIKRFTEYLIDSKYSYVVRDELDIALKSICLPDNMIVHKVEYDNAIKKRVFTKADLNTFFKKMDEYIHTCCETRNKAFKSAMRDKVVFSTMLGYGLRINETRMLDVTDFYPSPIAPEFGRFGYCHVRFGKASHGSNYKERRVHILDMQTKEMLEWYVEDIRPLFINRNTDDIRAMFYSERGDRISIRAIQRNFDFFLHEFNMHEDGLTPHSLRHTYSTLLQENPLISSHLVQKQLGHEYLSTTQHYTHLSDTFISKSIQSVVEADLKKRMDKIRERKDK